MFDELQEEIRKRDCYFCQKSVKEGCIFTNLVEKKDKDFPTFIYMPHDKSAHMECYIAESVRRSLIDLGVLE